jgi:ribosomal protein S18 acetylase RimI-like enzyme
MLTAMTAAEPPVIRRTGIDADAALALAARAWPTTERAGQLTAIAQLVADGKGGDLVLVAAYWQSRLCGAVLGQVLVGRAAVVWPPQLAAGQSATLAVELLDELHRQLAVADVCLAQALLEDSASDDAVILRAAGYEHAGDLLYMAAESASLPAELAELPLDMEAWSPANQDRLLDIIEATYRGSLDCPLVDGLRSTNDVLAGYRAVGNFRPEWWLLAQAQGRDVGCLLLADHPEQEQVEIVYLGIAPEHRGRGWGLSLTRHAQWLAYRAGRSRVVLAVDAANRPAIAAYEAAGFVGWDRRSILVRDFRPAATHSTAST